MLSIRDVKPRYAWGFVLGLASLCALLAVTAGAKSAVAPPAGLFAVTTPVNMPAFNLPTTTGGTLDSATLKDKVVIVRFWATW